MIMMMMMMIVIAGNRLTQGHGQWEGKKGGDQDREGHLLLLRHKDTGIRRVA